MKNEMSYFAPGYLFYNNNLSWFKFTKNSNNRFPFLCITGRKEVRYIHESRWRREWCKSSLFYSQEFAHSWWWYIDTTADAQKIHRCKSLLLVRSTGSSFKWSDHISSSKWYDPALLHIIDIDIYIRFILCKRDIYVYKVLEHCDLLMFTCFMTVYGFNRVENIGMYLWLQNLYEERT